MASVVTLPQGATVTPASSTKFGVYRPEVITDLQSSFYMSYRQVVTLTPAQLLAIQATPITLIPAPGPGLMIVPEAIIIKVQGGSAAYTDAGGAMSVTVGSMSAALAATTVITAPTANQRSQQIFSFNATSTAANPPTNENAALTLTKATNSFAAGNGVVTVTVLYTIESTT